MVCTLITRQAHQRCKAACILETVLDCARSFFQSRTPLRQARFVWFLALTLAIPSIYPKQADATAGADLEIDEQVAPLPKARPNRKPQALRRHHHGLNSATVSLRQDVVIPSNERTDGLFTIGGRAEIEGEVNGPVCVLFGSVKVNGPIRDDLVVVFGSVDLGPRATVFGDLISLGGPVRQDVNSIVEGERYGFKLLTDPAFLNHLHWARDWVLQGLLLARPLPHELRWVWPLAGAFILFYALLSFVFPRPVAACAEALGRRPVASFFLGLLSFMLLGPIAFLLAISFFGIPIIPILLCAVFGLVIFGNSAVFCYAGQQVTPKWDLTRAQLPLAVLVGAIFFSLLYMVPILGFAAWGVVTVLGFGSVLMAAFGGRRPDGPALQPVSPIALHAQLPTASPSLNQPPPTQTLAPPALGDPMLLPRVGFSRRFVATLLDFILLGMLIAAVEGYFLIFWSIYHILMWSWRGTTIGGIVMGTKIIRADGNPITFPIAVVRSLSSFFSAIVLFLGFFWAGWDRDKQSWHDKIAGTVVVHVPRNVSLV